ncbi:MAG: DUF4019 domain-containing protein [Desulfobacteraceae bacterium]|nr:DUF4019 domain-containing protein [Desulfobacteraceae bacterium]
MKKRYILFISILLICFGFNLSLADTKNDKVLSSAKKWLFLIDNGNYSDSWKDASTFFKTAVSEQIWLNSVRAAREPLGKLYNRNMLKSQEANHLPGAPDGKYIVMSFETAFENKKSSLETVTFMLDKDGKWRAAGYFIK